MPLETLSHAVDRLTAAGYQIDFKAEGGMLYATGHDCRHLPERLVVEEVVRFEGVSDPADEAILFALRCPSHGTKGTYTAAYGPRTPPEDEEVIRALELRGAGGKT